MQRASRFATTTNVIAYTSVSVAGTSVGPQTYQVRLVSNSACHVAIGDGAQTATSTKPFLPANSPEYFTITPGQSLAAIRAVTNGLVTATDGTLWVTEVT